MKGTPIVISAFLFVWAAIGIAAEETKPDPREKPETAVTEGIRLLEKEEYVDFLKQFVPPDNLKELTKKVPLEDFAKGFKGEKAERLLKALKLAKDVKPKLNTEQKEAVFEFKEKLGDKESITFKKIGKYWYIQN